jgi:hypothetical protein
MYDKAVNSITLKWLILSVLGTGGHETGHFILFILVSFKSDDYFICFR